MKKRSNAFKSRLFFSYSALVVLSVCLFLGALAVLIVRTGEAEGRASQKETALASLRQLESLVRELDTLAAQVMSNAQLTSYFVPLQDDRDDDNFFDANVLEFIDASSLLATLNGTSGTAARISVYNLGGDYVSAGTLYETPGRIHETLRGKEAIQAQLDRLASGAERRLIQEPGPDPFSSSRTNRLMSILKPLSSAYVSEVYGIVSVQQDVSAFEALAPFGESEGGVCLLMTEGGELILPAEPGEMALAAASAALSMDLPPVGEVVSAEHAGGGGPLFVSAARMDMSNWLLVMAQPRAHLLQAYRPMLWALALAGAALLLALLGVVYLMADRITRPLSALAESIGGVRISNMALAAPPPASGSATDEVIALDGAFREMLERMNESINFEMRAYLHALQSQMNPHFLYNILSVICATGQEEGSHKAVDMCLKLSGMLRYVADYKSDMVTLGDEIEHTERYLQLMKVRYEDNFHYAIQAEPLALGIQLPKLILQPITENCFQHGFDAVRPPWSIRLTVQLQGERFLITVADNGAGMSDETIAEIRRKVEDSMRDMAGNYPQLRIGGMGLVSTVLRLKLFLGDDMTYSILKSPEGGTMIQIGGKSSKN